MGILNEDVKLKPSMEKRHLMHYDISAKYAQAPKETMYDFLYQRVKKYMGYTALVYDDGKYKCTYEEMFDKIYNYAKAFYKMGIRENDVVAVSIANTPEAIFIQYALNFLGAVICQVNPRNNKVKLEKDMEILKPKVFIGIDSTYKNFKSNNAGSVLDYVFYSPVRSVETKSMIIKYGLYQLLTNNMFFDSKHKLDTILKNGENCEQISGHQYTLNRVSHILFTGGSTGVHKGVELDENGLNCVVRATDWLSALNPGDRFMYELPGYIAFGLFSLHFALCNAQEIHLVPMGLPKYFANDLLKIRPAGVFGGPIHWETLIDNKKIKGSDLSFLKMPVSGGEQLKIETERKVNDVLLKNGSESILWNGLGMTEMWAPTHVKRGADNTFGTVGTCLPFSNNKIVDPATLEELDYNQKGWLFVTGPGMMIGYHNNPEETNKVIYTDEEGTKWYFTGDIASLNEKGELEFKGREKRLFVCGWEKVYSEEWEKIISTLPEIKQVVVSRVPDEKLQFIPKIHIRLNSEYSQNESIVKKKIEKVLLEKLGTTVLPGYYEFHKKPFPLTESGKINAKYFEEMDMQQEVEKVTVISPTLVKTLGK